jgi:hypothetical protein
MSEKFAQSKGKITNCIRRKAKCFVDDSKPARSARGSKRVFVSKLWVIINQQRNHG